MAGRGPQPSPTALRGRASQRGEWTDVPHLEEPVLGPLPEGDWSGRTRAMWAGLQADPVTQTFGAAELAQVVELAHLHNAAVLLSTAAAWAEIRIRLDGLGLTPRGRRDLRLRVMPAADKKPAPPTRSRFTVVPGRPVAFDPALVAEQGDNHG